MVTPSRVCELKSQKSNTNVAQLGHTLTGVWVEIRQKLKGLTRSVSHTLTGVWVEIWCLFTGWERVASHTLTGVWVEIIGLSAYDAVGKSHPHGCVSWNSQKHLLIIAWIVTPSRVCELKCELCESRNGKMCHTLTGVWVEMKKTVLWLTELSHTLTGVWVEIWENPKK